MSERHSDHEGKWAFDEEVRFKAAVKRNRLLGLWAAGEMGLSEGEAEAYAKTVVSADFQEPGEEDVFRKVTADFAAKGISIPQETVRRKMHELTLQVRKELEGK